MRRERTKNVQGEENSERPWDRKRKMANRGNEEGEALRDGWVGETGRGKTGDRSVG